MPKPKKGEKTTGAPNKGQTRNHAQISMTIDPKILDRINEHAKAAGVSRSTYLVIAAQEKMDRTDAARARGK